MEVIMRELDPQDTSRAMSYELYIDAPMPMVTVFKTIDITRLVRLSGKGHKLNMLMCWCVAKAANRVPEFRVLPVGRKLVEYDKVCVNVIVKNKDGGLSSCDIPFDEDLAVFERSYLELTRRVFETCQDHELEDSMVVGTSCLPNFQADGVVNFYSGIFNNPFLIWGKYSSRGFRKLLKISFQFHHVQMDGEQAGQFLAYLQEAAKGISFRR